MNKWIKSDLALTKTGNRSVQDAMDWILSHPDWESELPEENPGTESQEDSQTQEATPV